MYDGALAANERAAAHNRERFHQEGLRTINLMGSPGSGKTSLLEATARASGTTARLGVLAGHVATDGDAVRLRAVGFVAEPITTGSACHVDADMVYRALSRIPWRGLDVLFVENVGNLICPALHDLGQDVNVVALSVTEGDDKPLKYPTIFQKADLVLLTKIDLLPYLPEVEIATIRDSLALVMPKPAMLLVSAKTGEGIADWLRWIDGIRRPRIAPCAAGVGV